MMKEDSMIELSEQQRMMVTEIRKLGESFDAAYWRDLDQKQEFPWEFFRALAEGGWFGITIPEEYGGHGLGMVNAAIVARELARTPGGFSGVMAVHTNMFGLEPIMKYGTHEQKERFLKPIAAGEHMMAVGITEPDAGFDTTKIRTRAVRDGKGYRITGRKTFLSRLKESKNVLLVTRTTPLNEVSKKTKGISLFVANADDPAISATRIPTLGRHTVPSYDVGIDGLWVPEENLIGNEGEGFYHLLNVLNPERISVAAEAIGLGELALNRACAYARERVIFDRAIGTNQAISFPLADGSIRLEAAWLMVLNAAKLYDAGKPCGAQANMAKYLAAEAAYEVSHRAIQTFGGHGYAVDNDVERFWRESRLALIAPISQEMVMNYVSEHVLDLPRSH